MSGVICCILKHSSKSFQCPFLSRNITRLNPLGSSKGVIEKEDAIDEPIKFSTSDAGWKSDKKKPLVYSDYPLYKEIIWWGAFLFYVHYFMFFRQRNDLDESLEMPLGQRYLWIQEQHLLRDKAAMESKGLTTKSIDEDLETINRLRKKYNYV